MAFDYPVNLDLAGRRVVVAGGGPLAASRIADLVRSGADVEVVTAAPSRPVVESGVPITRRTAEPPDLDGAFLAIVTREDDAPVEALWAAARERGVLFGAVDDVAHSDFGAASVVRRGALLITISTAGRAPALAKRLRQELEAALDQAHGDLVEVLHQARTELGPREVPFESWARAWEVALADLDALLVLVRGGQADRARDRVVQAVRSAISA